MMKSNIVFNSLILATLSIGLTCTAKAMQEREKAREFGGGFGMGGGMGGGVGMGAGTRSLDEMLPFAENELKLVKQLHLVTYQKDGAHLIILRIGQIIITNEKSLSPGFNRQELIKNFEDRLLEQSERDPELNNFLKSNGLLEKLKK